MSWLSCRWRTRQNAIINVNCRIPWIIKPLNATGTLMLYRSISVWGSLYIILNILPFLGKKWKNSFFPIFTIKGNSHEILRTWKDWILSIKGKNRIFLHFYIWENKIIIYILKIFSKTEYFHKRQKYFFWNNFPLKEIFKALKNSSKLL